jgi:integrase
MELIWATNDLVIGGRSSPGFPIILWDTMVSCIPVNDFLRFYLLRGVIGSNRSWPSTGRALYDYFSFLQAHDLDWRDVDRGESKSIVAGYRDYCLSEVELARTTVRQRLHYVCAFYKFAQRQGWVQTLPFEYEDCRVPRAPGYLAHLDTSGARTATNDAMPRVHRPLPMFLTKEQIRMLLAAADNPHHAMILRLGLHLGLRREEIATFPLSYVRDLQEAGHQNRNIRLRLDPRDGSGMRTKGVKPRDVYVSRRFMAAIHRYAVQIRGERATRSTAQRRYEPMLLNKDGEPFAADGKSINRIVRAIGKKCGISVHTHVLRHTYATHTLHDMQRGGERTPVEPLVFVQRQLGHSSIQTTMIYLHLVHALADDAVLAYDDELNRAGVDTD